MQRQNRKLSGNSKPAAKVSPENVLLSNKALANERGDPFATFTEWSGAADEKAYAEL